MTEVYLSPTVPGKLETLTVHEGDTVKAGQRVGTLDRYEQSFRDYNRALRLQASQEYSHQQLEQATLAMRDQQLISTIDGVILQRISEPGEVLTPGVPAVIIGNPNDVWVRVYIPGGDIGRVVLGQSASVVSDSFSGRRFSGKVTFISPEAEFTPKNVQTKEERVTQMFQVKISIDHPEGILKPGMPADVTIESLRG